MKTAAEYAQRLGLWAKCDKDELREALLAAYRQGCTDAARIVGRDAELWTNAESLIARRDEILALRDQKKLEGM